MKKLVTAVMVVAFALSSASLVMANTKCTVDSVDGDKVTMTCEDVKFKAGDKVQVKGKAKKALEGC
ncbi:MAG: hypothetical protein SCH71_10735 [Desulfobulbaceae bacterium]|nr:hypothetical protein [Desulfobulbaceae bacterium]